MTSFQLTTREYRGLTVLEAAGEMDQRGAVRLRSQMDKMFSLGCSSLLLNLSRVSYLDGPALGGLLKLQRKIRLHRVRLALVPSPAIREILNLTRLDRHFLMARDMEEAGRLLQGVA